MRILLRTSLFLSLFCLLPATINAEPQATSPSETSPQWDEKTDGPLLHWDGRIRPEPDPNRSLRPYAIHSGGATPPASGLIESNAEYDPAKGVIFRYSTYAWPQEVTDCVAAITGDPTKNDRVYIVVADAAQQQSATTQFTAAGADMSKVEFILMPSDSIWLTDYGPNYVRQDGAHVIVDGHYYIIPRTLDNFVPTLLAEDYFKIPVYHMGLSTSARGNFLVGPNRSAFVTDMISYYNPNFTAQYIAELYQEYLGIDTLHIFPELPPTVDATGHIDMWMCVIDDDTVIISEFIPGSNPTAIQITENAVTYMQNLGFQVFRVPDHNGRHPNVSYGEVHFTYTNSIRINDRILIPSYGGGDPSKLVYDNAALAAFQAAAPSCQIIQIPCYDIIWAAGALHCISMNVPLRVDPIPAAHLISPDGGELLVCGTNHTFEWAACDDVDVTGIDLYYSIDGGMTYPHLIASGLDNDSQEDWTVPLPPSPADQAMVKVVANDGAGNAGEDESESILEIREALQTVYDFSTNGGVDRWGWGSSTLSWSDLDGVRHPASVSTEIVVIDRDAYDKLAASDATGGDWDQQRYVSLKPWGGQETTHIFEFTIKEDPGLILDIGILWEGYGDDCGQMEVYVWDSVGGNWSDGGGTLGENMYMANYAGNRDDVLVGHIRDNFGSYVDGEGKLTLLLYGEYTGKKSFHDYIAITVTHEFTLAVDVASIPETTGGTAQFSLDAGVANANRNYLLLGGISGTDPGTLLPGGEAVLPLNWDGFTTLVVIYANSSLFQNFMATLDGQGSGSAQLNLGPVPGFAGTMMYFAYALDKPWNFASNPVTIEIVP